MKIGLFYDPDKKHRHVFVTENNHKAFEALIKEHAGHVLLRAANLGATG
jgi:hypothetical protein